MLKVLLDARKLADGGIGTYLHNLITGFLRDSRINLSLLVASGMKGAYFNAQQVEQIEESAKPYSLHELLLMGPRLSWLNRKARFDIFHEPHFTLPFFLSIPSVVTVHDLIHVTNPERWYYPAVSRVLIAGSLKRAKKIITVSEASRQAILEQFSDIKNITQKVNVVPNAMAENLLNEPEDYEKQLMSSFRLKPGYFFSLFSMLKPHKGFSDLVEAYKRISRSGIELPALVVAGRGTSALLSDDGNLLKMLQDDGVQVLGEVTEAELSALYKGARAVVVPSLIEGFGLSALEAKVLGTALVSRPLPSLAEIADSDDIISSDFSVDALSEALKEAAIKIPLLKNKPRNTLLAERFKIDSVAASTINIYFEAQRL